MSDICQISVRRSVHCYCCYGYLEYSVRDRNKVGWDGTDKEFPRECLGNMGEAAYNDREYSLCTDQLRFPWKLAESCPVLGTSPIHWSVEVSLVKLPWWNLGEAAERAGLNSCCTKQSKNVSGSLGGVREWVRVIELPTQFVCFGRQDDSFVPYSFIIALGEQPTWVHHSYMTVSSTGLLSGDT